MTIIATEVIERVKELRKAAQQSRDYDDGYHFAMRAIEAAIAAMEEVNNITSGYSLNITLEKR